MTRKKRGKIGLSNLKSKTKRIHPFHDLDKLMCRNIKWLIPVSAGMARDRKEAKVFYFPFNPLANTCFFLSLWEWTLNSMVSKTLIVNNSRSHLKLTVKKMKRLAKEHVRITCRHRQQCGDGQREGGRGLGGFGKRKGGDICNSIKNKNLKNYHRKG